MRAALRLNCSTPWPPNHRHRQGPLPLHDLLSKICDKTGFGAYSGTTTYTPTYGITGYTTETGSYTTYTRFLLLDAYDLAIYKREQKLSQVWKTNVISIGRSNDLRFVFPYMVAALKPYVAENTGRLVQVDIEEASPAVLELIGASGNAPIKK